MSSIFCIKRNAVDFNFEAIAFDASIEIDSITYNATVNPSSQDKKICMIWFGKKDDICNIFDPFPGVDEDDEESDYTICPQLLQSIPTLFKDFKEIVDIGLGHEGCIEDWESNNDIFDLSVMEGIVLKYNTWYRVRIH